MTTEEFMKGAAEKYDDGYAHDGRYISNEDTLYGRTNREGWTLKVQSDHSIHIIGPNASSRLYEFDTQQDWEDFGYEVGKETEHYYAVKKTDLVEFINAMKFVRSYQENQCDQARQHITKVQGQIERDETSIKGMDEIMKKYEEVYNENKVQ